MAGPKRIDPDRVRTLRRGGYSLAQIAEDQGVSRNAVHKHLKRMEALPAVEVRASTEGVTVVGEGVDHDLLAVAIARALKRLGYSVRATRG